MDDLNALQNIDRVIKSGHVILPEELLPTTPEILAQQQLNAYNARDIDAFLEPYAGDVKIYTFPDQLLYEGKDAMRQSYSQVFENLTDLHCKLVNRIVQGNTVVDHEEVVFSKDRDPAHAIAIYKIKGDKIAEVYLIQ